MARKTIKASIYREEDGRFCCCTEHGALFYGETASAARSAANAVISGPDRVLKTTQVPSIYDKLFTE